MRLHDRLVILLSVLVDPSQTQPIGPNIMRGCQGPAGSNCPALAPTPQQHNASSATTLDLLPFSLLRARTCCSRGALSATHAAAQEGGGRTAVLRGGGKAQSGRRRGGRWRGEGMGMEGRREEWARNLVRDDAHGGRGLLGDGARRVRGRHRAGRGAQAREESWAQNQNGSKGTINHAAMRRNEAPQRKAKVHAVTAIVYDQFMQGATGTPVRPVAYRCTSSTHQ